MRKVYVLLVLSFISFAGFSQTISYGTLGSTYSQNFDALPNSGTYTFASNGPLEISVANNYGGNIPGWYVEMYSGSGSNISWAFGTGSSTTGSAYSFGSAAATDRALGSLASAAKRHRYGALITNNTGVTINKFTVSFYTEMWRRGNFASGNTNAFDYKVGATALNDASGFTTSTSLNMVTPNIGATNNAASDGNLAANRTLVTSTIGGLNWANGQVLAIRWTDADETGSDDGLALDDFTFSADVQTTTNFYSKAVGNLTATGTWGTNTDGTGTAPLNFTDDGQVFNVVNSGSVTLDANWTVSGSGSKVITGDGAIAQTLIIPNTATLTGTVDVTTASTLRLENTVLPTFGALDINSTVNYAQVTTPYTVPTGGTYSNLSITNGTKVLNFGSITINGNLVVDGVTNFNGSGSPFSTINLGGNFTLQNGAAFESIATGEANRMTLIPTGTTTQTLSGGDFYLFRIQTPTTGSTTVNVALSGANLILGNTSLNGAGGLDMRQATHTLSLGSGNTLTLHGEGSFVSTNLATISGSTTSNIVIDKTVFTNNIGSISFTPGFQQLNNLSYNCTSGTSTTLTLATPLVLSGNLTMTAGLIDIGANDLTVTGTASGLATSYIKTSGAGSLKQIGVNAARSFPIGNAAYNPLIIANGSGNDFFARVENGVNNPSGSIPTDAVLRTWYLKASAVTLGVTVTYQYNLAECTAGAATQTNNMEILQSDGSVWSLVAGNGSILSVGTDPYTVTSVAGMTISNGTVPYTLGLSGTVILANDCLISCSAHKQSSNGLISFNINSCTDVTSFEVQRSVNGGAFQTINNVSVDPNSLDYNFTDHNLAKGTSLYRIKVTRRSGAVKYSNVAAIINDSQGMLITGVWPNPVTDKASLMLTMARAGKVSVAVYNLSGVQVKQWVTAVSEGTNAVNLVTTNLPAGMYTVQVSNEESRSLYKFVKQ